MITRPLDDDLDPHGESTSPPPCVAGRYEIRGLVGMGGMGSVYRVHDRELDEIVALKFLRQDALGPEATLGRFRDEARLARRVSHVNVARTFDIGEHAGQRYLTMEFVEGESLARMLEREGALPLARVADLTRQICAGLGAAHAAGVVHRDLKPDNVLIARGGRVVISDFGVARELQSGAPAPGGAIFGTAAYMAPEQLEDGAVDARSDLYALGALLYETITGARAWPAESLLGVPPVRLGQPPPDPAARRAMLPPGVAAVVTKCMATRKEDRFAAASDVPAALDAALADAVAITVASPGLESMSLAARAFRVAPAPGERATNVAVLPFKNQGLTEDDFLANELTDELIDALSMTGGLRVRPRRLVERHAAGELSTLARALDVQVVVEGTIRRAADKVRISARAIGVAEGLQIWARRFERPADELLGVNDEVARAIGEALATRADGPRRTSGSVDGRTSELYLRARSALRRSWGGTGDLPLAVELFRQALARAPSDGGLLSGFAMARARQYNYHGGDAREVAAIRELAEKAIAQAPHLGEPWQTLATLSYVTSEWPDAVRSLRRALRLAPGLLKAHEALAHIEIESGRVEEGLFRLETVMSLDPTPSMARWEAARANALLGRWERTTALLALPVEDEPDRLMRTIMATRFDLWRGEVHEPIVPTAMARQQPHLFPACAFTHAVRGQPVPAGIEDEARRRITQTGPRSRLRPMLLQFLAEVSLGTGEHAKALDFVREAVGAELYDRAWLSACPLLAPLRSDPSWPALAARVDERADAVIAAIDETLA